jgi:hypothetical protein
MATDMTATDRMLPVPESEAAVADEVSKKNSPFLPSDAAVRLRDMADRTGLSFLCVDAGTGIVVESTDDESLSWLPMTVLQILEDVREPRVIECSSQLLYGLVPLAEIDGHRFVAVTTAFCKPGTRPDDLVLAAAEKGWSSDRLDQWMARQPHCSPLLLERLLIITSEQADSRSEASSLQADVTQLSNEIEQTYEEISLLHSLTQNLQISRGPVEVAQLCVSRMHGLIESAGNIIWLEDKQTGSHFLIEGDIPFDEIGLARLISRFDDYDWARPLVKNRVQGTLLGSDYPGLENFVIVPITGGSHRSGWILSCNLRDNREFGSVEGSLLNSVATILGTHVRNIDLYQQHEDLLISFVRSLVSTLDAKDPYTRGHSERVALISRRLGQHLNLPEEDLNDIYLSGMLHDVGKIGVDDRVLQKPGKLTDEEFEEIKEHPMIGYNILKGMKNLQKILPGVRHHHESVDGTGYPDKLAGDEIPLMARIMAVADAYDAMGSSRVYRKGMPLEKLEDIFRNGSGQQWDSRIIDAYFELRDEIRQICDTYAPDERNLLEGTRVTSRIP